MRQREAKVGEVYAAKVSGKWTKVRLLYAVTYGKGWIARNETTGREVHILTAQRLHPTSNNIASRRITP